MPKPLLAPLRISAKKEKANVPLLYFKTPFSIEKLAFGLVILEVPVLKDSLKIARKININPPSVTRSRKNTRKKLTVAKTDLEWAEKIGLNIIIS
jgi:hypothetical protein